MGTTLTGTTPQDTYDSLIKVTDNGPISGTAKFLSDGLGNDSALALSTGNIGIGTTTAPEKLSVAGAIITTGGITGHGANRVSISQEGANGAFIQSYGANTSTVGNFTFRQASSDFSVAQIPLAITSTGNVGIGTSAPAQKLTVSGNGFFGGTNANIYIDNGGVGGSSLILGCVGTSNGYIATDGNFPIFIQPNGTTRVRIDSDGLKFNADTAAANALDDYEEGTWTMGVSFGGASVGVTTSTNTGTYTKIGRQVTVNGYILLSSKGSSTGNARITGLPFTIGNSSGNSSSPSLYFSAISFANIIVAYGVTNTTTVELEESTEAGTNSNITNSDFANNSAIVISFTYFV